MSHRIERWHREREPVPDPGGAGGAETNQWFFKTGAGEYGEALLILVGQHVRGDDRAWRAIHQLYLRHTGSVNNWDLVDSSAAQIVGAHLATRDRRVLRRLARARDAADDAAVRDRKFSSTAAAKVHGAVS